MALGLLAVKGTLPSRAEQDAKLLLLLDWARGYYSRTDDLSLRAHRRLFDSFSGPKREI